MRNFFFKGSGAIHFDSVNELDSLAGNLDDAELVPIYAINPFSEECEEIPNKSGVMNKTTGEIAAVVSDTYSVIKHSKAIQEITQGIRLSGHDISGSLYNTGNGVMVRGSILGSRFSSSIDERTFDTHTAL